MMMGPGWMEMLMVLMLSGGGLNLPVGLPPMPEDAKIAQAAPAEVLAYISWAGTAEADPKSGNSAERILADPQVKYLMKRIEEGLVAAINREAGREGEEMKTLVKHGHLLIKQMLLRPTAIYVSKLDIMRANPAVEAGLVVNFGKDAAAAKNALQAIENMIAAEIGPFQEMPANQGGLRRMPIPEDEGPLVAWGFEGDYFILAVGPESAGRLRGAIAGGKAPAWLTDMKKTLAVKRNSSLMYINVPALLKMVGPMLAAEMTGDDRQVLDRIFAALGLNKVTAIASATGFDDTKFVSRSLIAIDGKPSGLFKLVSGTGLTQKDLGDIPADADLAVAVKLNPSEIWDEAMKIMGEIEPELRDDFLREMEQAPEEVGFRIKEDMFDSIGDVWSIYNSPSDGGLVITGLTGVVHVKDRAKAQKVIDGLERAFNQEFNRNAAINNNVGRPVRQYQIKSLEHEGQTIRYINAIGDDWVVAPAWCLTKDRFIIAPYPQMVKSYLSRAASTPAGKTLADVAGVKALFGDNAAAPAVVSYVDTPELFKKFYPLAHPLATLICAEIQREGFDIDVAALPTASAILPHLSPDTGTVRRTTAGILFESRQSLPMAGAGSMLPALFWMGYADMRVEHGHHDTVPRAFPDDAAPPFQCGAEELEPAAR